MRWIQLLLLSLILVLFGCQDQKESQEPSQPQPDKWEPAGFADVSFNGMFGIVEAAREHGKHTEKLSQVARITSFNPIKYAPLYELSHDSVVAAGFTGSGNVWYARRSGNQFHIYRIDFPYDEASSTVKVALADNVPRGADWRAYMMKRERVLPSHGHYYMSYLVGTHNGQIIEVYIDDVKGCAYSSPLIAGASPTILDDRRIAFFQLVMQGEEDSKLWNSYLVTFEPIKRVYDTLFQFESSYGVVQDHPANGELYFLSSQPDQKAGNVWKFSPFDSSFTQITHLAEPEYVSSFHVIGNTLQYLVRDRTREPGLQCQYRSLDL